MTVYLNYILVSNDIVSTVKCKEACSSVSLLKISAHQYPRIGSDQIWVNSGTKWIPGGITAPHFIHSPALFLIIIKKRRPLQACVLNKCVDCNNVSMHQSVRMYLQFALHAGPRLPLFETDGPFSVRLHYLTANTWRRLNYGTQQTSCFLFFFPFLSFSCFGGRKRFIVIGLESL